MRSDRIQPLLSLMTTCGMYDRSGSWVYNLGLPAKSGVGGGVTAVRPGQLGIGVYAPRLDACGNSAGGVAMCQRISTGLGLHLLQPLLPLLPAVAPSACPHCRPAWCSANRR